MLQIIKERNLEVAKAIRDRIREADSPCAVGITPDYEIRVYRPDGVISIPESVIASVVRKRPSGLVMGY